jgi:predicted membrane channel-forming protein YqfA (hemolysin III family)
MRLNNLISFVGFVILIAGTYCPILRPLHLFNWDVYDGNKPYGIVMLLVAIVGILGTVMSQQKIVKLTAWLSLALVTLFLLLAWLKVHTSFTFIPFQAIENLAIKSVKYKWGWYLLFGGAMLAVIGALSGRKDMVKAVQ